MQLRKSIKKQISESKLKIGWIDIDIEFIKHWNRDLMSYNLEDLQKEQKELNSKMSMHGVKEPEKKEIEVKMGEVFEKINEYKQLIGKINNLIETKEELIGYITFLKGKI